MDWIHVHVGLGMHAARCAAARGRLLRRLEIDQPRENILPRVWVPEGWLSVTSEIGPAAKQRVSRTKLSGVQVLREETACGDGGERPMLHGSGGLRSAARCIARRCHKYLSSFLCLVRRRVVWSCKRVVHDHIISISRLASVGAKARPRGFGFVGCVHIN